MNIKAVAKLANVSTATVSRTINGSPKVSPDTAARVQKAVESLNFVLNTNARALGSGRSNLLGLIISDITNPFFPELVKAFEDVAVSRGHEVLIANTDYDPDRTMLCVTRMLQRKVDGVAIMTSELSEHVISFFLRRKIPVVFLDTGAPAIGISRITIDYPAGVEMAMSYLTRIAFISGPLNLTSARTRYQAFTESSARDHLAARTEYIQEGNHRPDGGYEAMQRLLALSVRPTAVLTSNDLTAIGAMGAIFEAGLRIPEDISIIGFDDIQLGAYTAPPLTTVRLPHPEIARTAVHALLGRQDDPKRDSSMATSTRFNRYLWSGAPPDPYRRGRRLRGEQQSSMETLAAWCIVFTVLLGIRRSLMKRSTSVAAAFLLTILSVQSWSQVPGKGRWSEQKANDWYAQQPWLVGANYIPSDAINELVMFQAATFNPEINDHELGLAESIGMNTARVFLQDQLWKQDPEGFKKRLDIFLGIAAKHHIRPLLVLFDSCWETNPHLGPQHPPIPGVHNSGWVQSPGKERLLDRAVEPELKAYVVGVVGAFADDPRILGWDVWNEPDNKGGDKAVDEAAKVKRVDELLPKKFAWARSAHPSQPLTSGVCQGDWSHAAKESETTKIQLAESDIISFHNYGWPEEFEARIQELQPLHRPIICTEYMARGAGSTFDGSLPVAKKYHVGAINWGLVAGQTQTYYPWDSWDRPYTLTQPTLWFHEVFRNDGTPYRQREVDLIRELTGRGTATASAHASVQADTGTVVQ